MSFHVRLWKGIFQPYKFYQLREAEDVVGFFWRFIALFMFSGLLSGFSVYTGLDTETFTRLLGKETTETIETMKFLFGIGSVLHGIISPMIVLYVSSLVLWFFLKEIEFHKIMTIQLYVIFIKMIENTLWIIFRLITGADTLSSPFGLGVLAQLATDQPFVLHLMNSMTIFGIWAIVIQILALKICSSLSIQRISIFVIALYLFINIFASLLSLIDVDHIFNLL
jgi:hypothetical protein